MKKNVTFSMISFAFHFLSFLLSNKSGAEENSRKFNSLLLCCALFSNRASYRLHDEHLFWYSILKCTWLQKKEKETSFTIRNWNIIEEKSSSSSRVRKCVLCKMQHCWADEQLALNAFPRYEIIRESAQLSHTIREY